jgi:pyruvate formate-lyase activating enzyme-like uncharacterized protein
VVFVTGRCGRGCWYCPVSPERKGRDVAYANERPIRDERDLLEEARLMSAEGASLTGGDITLRLDRCEWALAVLKGEFGEDFHVHAYVPAESVDREALDRLAGSGLDELRIHPSFDEDVNERAARLASRYDWDAGFEMPAIPGREDWIVEVARIAERYGLDFLNVNELEFTESNARELRSRGLRRVSDDSDAVEGSEETALCGLARAADEVSLTLHYCPSSVKDSVQLRERLKRTALNVAREHEMVDEDGMIVRGEIRVRSGDPEDVARVLTELLEVPEEWVRVRGDRVEVKPVVLQDLSDLLDDIAEAAGCELEAVIVREYPTWDRTVVEVWPVGED